ncbi:MAG: EAL domain-containing protein [bacterium]|nr:EAL domain-containing protein [bacterium]
MARSTSAEPKILLITADQVLQALAVPALSDSGFRVFATSRGTTAAQDAATSPPDAVLLDLLVEDADAVSLRSELRKLPNCHATPIFVMSDLFDPGLITSVYKDPFSEFLPKPINWLVLPHRLRQAVVVGRSVAELHEYQQSLEQAQDAARSASTEALKLRNFDQLTGLPNRATFTEIVALAVAQTHNRSGEMAVLFIDIDSFKEFNDSLGRDSGDLLLRAIAGRLRSALQQKIGQPDEYGSGIQGALARIHADEFAILLDQVGDRSQVRRLADDLLAAVMAPYSVIGRDVFVSASVGMAFASRGEGEAVLQCAETAMRHAKRAGGKTVRLYTDSMKDEVLERLELQERLRRAIDNNELRLHYQPIIDIPTGQIVGLEGLVRWTDAQRGPISPATFIPIAEEAGLVVAIGDWVIAEACRQLAAWVGRGLPPLRMAVNVARAQIEEALCVEKMETILRETGIEPEYLELELSERGVFRNDPLTLEKLRRLEALGLTLAIDDFGTGQTTLAYLQSFPLDVLKIDQSFVSRIGEDPATEAIIRAIIAMSHELELRVVGEGVETKAQAETLRTLQCDELQGFLYYHPLPPREIEPLLRAQADAAAQRPAEDVPSSDGTEGPFSTAPSALAAATEEEIFRMAHVDFLTDLLNRYSFERALETTLARAQRFGHQVALLVLDLDQFKEVNDSHGHSAGDELLSTLARRLKAMVRQVDSLARLGGDEFALIHSEFKTLDGVATLAQRLGDEIAKPVSLGSRTVRVTASIGIAVYPPGDSSPKNFYRQADLALYKAKGEGGNCFHFHANEMDRQVQLKLQLGRDLEKAIDRDEMHLVYQPQFSLTNRMIVAVEALVRWSHPKRGLVPPSSFIPIAEDNGEIIRIGEWVLRQACTEARSWMETSGVEIPVSVNLSYVQFRLREFPKAVERVLRETQLPPRLLEFELNQRMLLRFENDLERLTRGLDSLGVGLCVDDFGTSPFSIEDLTHLPFSKLKVDGRHIQASDEDDGCPPLVKAVIALGKKLNLGIVAEAVETQAQLAALRDERCDFGQGHLFSRPMTSAQLSARLAADGAAQSEVEADVLPFPQFV